MGDVGSVYVCVVARFFIVLSFDMEEKLENLGFIEVEVKRVGKGGTTPRYIYDQELLLNYPLFLKDKICRSDQNDY